MVSEAALADATLAPGDSCRFQRVGLPRRRGRPASPSQLLSTRIHSLLFLSFLHLCLFLKTFATMAYPSRITRPKRQSGVSSLMSKLTLFAFVLVAVLCFLPAGSQVRAEEKDVDVGTVIGIDLGTTYSCVA